ncbi:uncharacterized protein [Leptinotarsa decemlineata]|uniref:uncharacterized protein n=1 Tax=Leptinotarsa decemlineata TaxID=7539 RepID=UPI003D308721
MHPTRSCQFLIFLGIFVAYISTSDEKHFFKRWEGEKSDRRAHLQSATHKQLRNISKHLLKKLDTSCKQIPPPEIKNGRLIKLKKRKVASEKFYMVAEFKCHEGFVFEKPLSGKMYCSRSRWVGKMPDCKPATKLDISQKVGALPKIHLGECHHKSKSKCPHLCYVYNGRTTCGCPPGFQEVNKNCEDINECEVPKIRSICKFGCINSIGSYHCLEDSNGYLSDAPVENNDTIPNDDEEYDDEEYDDEEYDEEDYDEDDYEDADYDDEKHIDGKEADEISNNDKSEESPKENSKSKSESINEGSKNNDLLSDKTNIKSSLERRNDSEVRNGDKSDSYDDEYGEDYKDYDEEVKVSISSSTSTVPISPTTTPLLTTNVDAEYKEDDYDEYDEGDENEVDTKTPTTMLYSTSDATSITSTSKYEIGLDKPENVDGSSISKMTKTDNEDTKESGNFFASNEVVEFDDSTKERVADDIKKTVDISSNGIESTTNENLDGNVKLNERIDTEIENDVKSTEDYDEYDENDYDESEGPNEVTERMNLSDKFSTTNPTTITSSTDGFHTSTYSSGKGDAITEISTTLSSHKEYENEIQYNRNAGTDTDDESTESVEISTQNSKDNDSVGNNEDYEDEDYDDEYEESTIVTSTTISNLETTKKPIVAPDGEIEEDNSIRRYYHESSNETEETETEAGILTTTVTDKGEEDSNMKINFTNLNYNEKISSYDDISGITGTTNGISFSPETTTPIDDAWGSITKKDSMIKETENRDDKNYDIHEEDQYEEYSDNSRSFVNSTDDYEEKYDSTVDSILENVSSTPVQTPPSDVKPLKNRTENDEDENYDDDDDEEEDYDEGKRQEPHKEESMVVENEVDKCEDGFILDQNHKCIDVDECNPDTNPCSDICENTLGSYICKCSKGFKLSTADIHVCQDIDECLESPCSHSCTNLEGSYRCDCPKGLTLQNTTCVNLTCSHGETKINGQIQCTCPSGFVLGFDNRTCEDVDECLLFNDCSHNCQNSEGSYSCSCREGFKLENGKVCVDIDECQGKHGCSQVCKNTPGSFECSCYDGYEYDNSTKSCVDIDECDEQRDLDECTQICINYNGGYECACRSGFRLASDDSTCEDVDECSVNNGNCSHTCQNLPGSFICHCKQNYNLEGDNRTCKIVNPCLEENGGCSHQCVNSHGSAECRCPLGYSLEGKQCFLRDPCLVDNGKCSHICINANGAVRCNCPPGYELENPTTCHKINPCTINNGNCSHFCEYIDGHVNCLCPELYSLRNQTHCVEINPCLIDNGGCSHTCHFENHRQTCSCPHTHELHNQTYCFEKNPCLEENGGCSDICVYKNGTLTCGCPENYYLEGKICYRVDPCLIGNGGCSHECFSDEEGNVQCSCPRSLHLQKDRRTCIPDDPCLLDNGDCSHICDSSTGKAVCSCPAGYVLRNITHCEFDPCSVGNGGCSHSCRTVDGEVECSCPDHYNLVNKTTCVGVNPCFINNGGCSHECATEGNKVICLCPEGYTLEGKECSVINPCDHKNGGCSHICSSINGQVVCKCPPDFELINRTCFKINPCSLNNGGCSHGCTNIKGYAKCTCPPGYKLFGKKCMDEDPCSKNNGGCSHSCQNREGKRECSCPPGYLLRPNKRVCKEVNECRVNRGGCSHGCKNLPGSYQCTCPHGLKLDSVRNKTCVDIDECLVDNGKCEMICRNFKGGHKCDCPEGYILQVDRRSCKLGNTEQCRVPSSPKHGVLRCLDHRADYGSFVPSGTKCRAYCNEGYKLIGQFQRICNSAGVWEHDEPRCVVATCPKLPPIQNGWYLPGVCNSGRTYSGESCEIYCRKGFVAKQDIEKYVCDSNMQWMPNVRPEHLRDACVRHLPNVNIRCPSNGHIEFVLPPGQRHAFVKIPRPETNIDWNFVTSQPSWATRLENTLPAGRTEVRFTAVSPSDFNSSASCHLVINVLDKELPKIMMCPENIERTLGKGEHMQIVHWREPEFHDNVGIATVYKSREPGSEFGLGLHHITYVASDEAGNRAFCHFSINVRDDLQSEESNSIKQHPTTYANHQTTGKYRAVLICPSGVQYMSSHPDNYNNMITSEAGCYWRHVRVTRPMQPQNYRVPPKVHSESSLPSHMRSNRRVFFKWNR